ncbi:MAG: DUF4293 domain-containing protein [Flavobacteriales bacterium]|nr:DUF4293 domain-containing protein [Flavobacteriales bacterium]
METILHFATWVHVLEVSVAYSPSLVILLVNVVLYFLAVRRIKKDDALVRSADRLR